MNNNNGIYIELVVAIQDIFHELRCDVCGTTSGEKRAIDANQAKILGIMPGIFHRDCVTYLRQALGLDHGNP